MKRVILSILMLAGAALLGCQTPGKVIDRLPAPYVASLTPPRTPAKPQPTPTPREVSVGGKRVVIDAGHGGKDPGAPAHHGGWVEKRIVLDIAQEVAGKLRARGVNVTMTRDSDVFIELDDRAAVAERTRADLFVSIHADSAQNASASGATFYIARNASPQSLRAGLRFDSTFKKAGLESRGVQPAGFRVLVGHSRPAVLVEAGFMSNRTEARKLNTASYREKVAEAIADGVISYLGG